MRIVATVLVTTATLAAIAVTLFLGWLAFARARLPYENGRHFDAAHSVMLDEGAVTLYALLALGFGLLAALLSWLTRGLWKRL
jgi:predicted lysophospholipase L1 biosynthesis ABC-type transport system permease subunit